jgi:hypothetical protein
VTITTRDGGIGRGGRTNTPSHIQYDRSASKEERAAMTCSARVPLHEDGGRLDNAPLLVTRQA